MNTRQEIVIGDCIDVMQQMADNSVDAVVCDPPYGLEFMGKDWDAPWKQVDTDGFRRSQNENDAGRDNVFGRNSKKAPEYKAGVGFQMWCEKWAREALRVLKPGGHILAFSGSRTYHRLACAIEDSGFEIRDQIQWLYGVGFPKSLCVSKAIDNAAGAEREVIGTYEVRGYSETSPTADGRNQWAAGEVVSKVGTRTAPATDAAARWSGWGTALKPAHEPIVLARKPLEGTVVANVIAHGTGALNIDGCRIEHASESDRASATPQGRVTSGTSERIGARPAVEGQERASFERPDTSKGRWPANVILDEEAGAALDAQSGATGAAARASGSTRSGASSSSHSRNAMNGTGDAEAPFYNDKGGASRFFYTTKTSKGEREAGLEHLPKRSAGELVEREEGSDGMKSPRAGAGRTSGGRANHHPTVKPIGLMRYLCRLVMPPGGLVLDPFAGSGTTGCAAALENVNFIGIEKEEEYAVIAKARIEHWQSMAAQGLDEKSASKKKKKKIDTQSAIELEPSPANASEIQVDPKQAQEQGENDMAFLPKAIADAVGSAKTAGGGNWIQHGDYIFLIKKWFYQETQDRCIIMENLVIESHKKMVSEGGKMVEHEPNPVGSDCSEVANFDGAGKLSANSNSRAPVLGLFGFKEGSVPNDVVSNTLSQVCDETTQPATGMLIACSTFSKEKRQTKGEYITGRNWGCVNKPGEGLNAPDLVQARVKALAISAEECVRVTNAQIAAARGTGAAVGVAAVTPAPTMSMTAPAVAAPSIPAPPVVAAPPAPPAVDPLAGWTANPQDPTGMWYYQTVNGQTVQKQKTELLAGR